MSLIVEALCATALAFGDNNGTTKTRNDSKCNYYIQRREKGKFYWARCSVPEGQRSKDIGHIIHSATTHARRLYMGEDMKNDYIKFVLFAFWYCGIVIAQGWWKLLATVFPPYAWYIFAEKMMLYYGII